MIHVLVVTAPLWWFLVVSLLLVEGGNSVTAFVVGGASSSCIGQQQRIASSSGGVISNRALAETFGSRPIQAENSSGNDKQHGGTLSLALLLPSRPDDDNPQLEESAHQIVTLLPPTTNSGTPIAAHVVTCQSEDATFLCQHANALIG